MARNDYETISLLEKLIAGYPDAPQVAGAHFLMAQSLSRQERYSEAAQAYLNYLALRPGQIDAYVLDLRGDALFAAGDYSGAKNDYQAALGAASMLDEIQLRLKLARAYAISGDAPTALALVRRPVQPHPKRLHPCANRPAQRAGLYRSGSNGAGKKCLFRCSHKLSNIL